MWINFDPPCWELSENRERRGTLVVMEKTMGETLGGFDAGFDLQDVFVFLINDLERQVSYLFRQFYP